MRRDDVSPERPLLVAHRAGNSPVRLERATQLGVDLIELDVRHYRGRMEVRHSKTLGPVPLLWDRWSLERGWRPRLLLSDVLKVAPAEAELMLDIKGGDPGFPLEVRQAMREQAPGLEYSVCSQFWDLLVPFRDEPGVRTIHSIGSRRALKAVALRLAHHEEPAIAVNQRLLTPKIVRYLRRHAAVVMSWPVNDDDLVERLRSWGVNGFIVDDAALLARLSANRVGFS